MDEKTTPEIRTFRLELSFDGTEYHGWQRQPNGITVQEVLEEKLCRLFNNTRIRVQGSSRTDSGVHALGMAASFQAPPSPYIPDWKVKKALNLPAAPKHQNTRGGDCRTGFQCPLFRTQQVICLCHKHRRSESVHLPLELAYQRPDRS